MQRTKRIILGPHHPQTESHNFSCLLFLLTVMRQGEASLVTDVAPLDGSDPQQVKIWFHLSSRPNFQRLCLNCHSSSTTLCKSIHPNDIVALFHVPPTVGCFIVCCCSTRTSGIMCWVEIERILLDTCNIGDVENGMISCYSLLDTQRFKAEFLFLSRLLLPCLLLYYLKLHFRIYPCQ